MIVDCTMFDWEFQLLDLRLRELWDVVDHFVVTESVCDHRGIERELALSNNLSKFDWASEKLIVNVSDRPMHAESSWDYERFQRLRSVEDAIRILNLDTSDFLLISDVDEIMRPQSVREISKQSGPFTIHMPMYYYYLNLYLTDWFHPKACRISQLQDPNKMRTERQLFEIVPNGGWHFSYLGDAKQIQAKLKRFAHIEFDNPEFTDMSKILGRIVAKVDLFERPGHRLRSIKIDDTWPKYVLQNPEKFAQWII